MRLQLLIKSDGLREYVGPEEFILLIGWYFGLVGATTLRPTIIPATGVVGLHTRYTPLPPPKHVLAGNCEIIQLSVITCLFLLFRVREHVRGSTSC